MRLNLISGVKPLVMRCSPRSEVPIIQVTARVDEVDRLLGLQGGADDYVCKPFSPREVVARVTAVLRRYRHSPAQMAQVLEIDEANFGARFRGRPLDLTPVEFRLLSSLAAAPLRVWSRDQLMNWAFWDISRPEVATPPALAALPGP